MSFAVAMLKLIVLPQSERMPYIMIDSPGLSMKHESSIPRKRFSPAPVRDVRPSSVCRCLAKSSTCAFNPDKNIVLKRRYQP
jgi:hypothetical protein